MSDETGALGIPDDEVEVLWRAFKARADLWTPDTAPYDFAVDVSVAIAKRDFPYPPDAGRTHYEGCWKERGHHNCAVARVRQLEERLIETAKLIEEGRWGRERQAWTALPPSPDA